MNHFLDTITASNETVFIIPSKEPPKGDSTTSSSTDNMSDASSTSTIATTSSRRDNIDKQKVALIAGVSGIVGSSLLQLLTNCNPPWKVYGIARRPKPCWLESYPVHYIQCDLLDREESFSRIASISDVTHLFYVTWTSRDTEEENCMANAAMFRNTLEPLIAHCKDLEHICLQTGIKHYIGSHFGFDGCSYISTFDESMPRRPETIFYYVQEDILFEAIKRRFNAAKPITWSIHRPGLIFGSSPESFVNSTLALAVYASICKHEGSPLVFPGTEQTWEHHINVSDSNLIAEQELWAATNPNAKNQAFNVSNGDDLTWKELWGVLGNIFGIEAKAFELGKCVSFSEIMRNKIHVWDAIVKEHGLKSTKLIDFIGGWLVLDLVLSKMPPTKSSMEKSKAFGFTKSKDTKESLTYWIGRIRELKLIP